MGRSHLKPIPRLRLCLGENLTVWIKCFPTVASQFVNGFVAARVKMRDWRIYKAWDVFITADGITLFTKSNRWIRKWSGGPKSLLNSTTTYCQTCWQLWTFLNTGPAFFHSYLGLGSRKTDWFRLIKLWDWWQQQQHISQRLQIAADAHTAYFSWQNARRCRHKHTQTYLNTQLTLPVLA